MKQTEEIKAMIREMMNQEMENYKEDPASEELEDEIDAWCRKVITGLPIVKEAARHFADWQRRIFVTHMVNPKGIQVLADNYHQVTITNSYCDWRTVMSDMPKNVAVVDVDKNWRFM